MLGASVSALVLAGLSVAQPAWAQAADTSVSTDEAKAKDAKKKAKATDEKANTAEDSDAGLVVITARRQALETATELKRHSDTIIDSVVADEAGKLPDNSITEVLQRVPGVTMSRFNGSGDSFEVEGTGIQVRGLSNATSLLNGREIFSANGGSGLSWGEVTPELMAAVDVYKATRADMIEGGTGGAIDLRTKMPFDYKKTTIEGAVSGSWGDLVKKVSPSASVLGSTRFQTGIGEIGILVDVAYSKLDSQDAHLSVEPFYRKLYQGSMRYIPGGFGWGDDHFGRERNGLYEALQWKPANNLTFFQSFFSSRYKSHNDGLSAWVASDHVMPISGNATFDKNGVMTSAQHMGQASFNDGSAGTTVGQSWIPADQQVTCDAPYGTQAMSLNWGASPPNCQPSYAGAGSSRGFSTTDNLTHDFSQGFTWKTDRIRLRGAAQYVDSKATSTGMAVGLFVPVTGFSMDLTGKLPKIVIDNSDMLSNRNSYGWSQLSYRPTNNRGKMWAGNLDFDYDIGEGFFKTISVGGRVARRDEHDNYDGTYWTPLGNGWDGTDQKYLSDGPAKDSEYYPFPGFFHGEIPVPHTFYAPSASLISSEDFNYIMNTYGYYKSSTKADGTPVTSPADVIHVPYGHAQTRVNTNSAYLQMKFGSESGLFGVPFTGNIGVRAVETKTISTGDFVFGATTFYMTQADANADFQADPTGKATPRAVTLSTAVTPRADASKDTRVLPAFNINFKPTDKFYVRLAANQTVARPGFGDITVSGSGSVSATANANNFTEQGPNGSISHVFAPIFNNVTASIGNTELKPTISTNIDLSLEWYRSQSTNLHVALFHKSLKDLIIFGDTIVPFPYSFKEGNGTVVNGSSTLRTTQATNATTRATIQGFEFGGRTFFDKLPGFWSGFGIDANFTFIDSKDPAPKAYDMDGVRFGTLPVVGLSRYSYNIQLMYSKKKFYAGLAYNWRSRWLMGTSTNGTGGNDTKYTSCTTTTGTCEQIHYSLPLYGANYGQLDFGMNYQFSPHLRVYVQANNLTNTVAKSQMEILPGKFYPRNFYESDRRVDFGINFKF
jgi:TonB-dependent receptor